MTKQWAPAAKAPLASWLVEIGRGTKGNKASVPHKPITDPSDFTQWESQNDSTDHVLHRAQVLGALAVAVILCQVCCRETILVFDAQVHAVHHEDLTTLEWQKKKKKSVMLVCVLPGGKTWRPEPGSNVILVKTAGQRAAKRLAIQNRWLCEIHTASWGPTSIIFQKNSPLTITFNAERSFGAPTFKLLDVRHF